MDINQLITVKKDMESVLDLETNLASNRCESLQYPSKLNLVLSILILLGILVSYSSQHRRIIVRGTPEGISPYFILLGMISGTCALANVLTIPASLQDVACCKVINTYSCLAGLLGIAQIALQWLCFVVIVVLFLIYFPRGSDSSINCGNVRYTWRTAVIIACVCFLHGLLVSTISSCFLLFFPAYLQTWANFLGIMGAILAIIQYLPQIWTTWNLGHVGSLSISMMCIQTPGSLIWSGSLLARLGIEGWSTWGVYLVTGCLQGSLLVMGTYFECKKRNTNGIFDEEGLRRGFAESDDEGGPVGRKSPGPEDRSPLIIRKAKKKDYGSLNN